jgi:RNA polymerase sigma-70 factor (ECF subfamily)
MGAASRKSEEGERFLRRMSAAYRQPLTRFFRRRTGSDAEADDLTQEVFLRLLRHPDASSIDNPEAFLFRTAVNLLRDRARRAHTRAQGLSELTLRLDGVEGLSPQRVLEGRQSLDRALRALGELDVRARDAFMLHRLEGLKYAEIAELFGVSVSSVEKYVIKALAHLARRGGQI